MSGLEIPSLERPSFFDGQRLTADDLADVQSFHRELRWLHNRSLHNWGIAAGFAVSGSRGQRAVQVQAGFALDCKGREVILGEGLEMPIPAVSGASDGGPANYFLTATYAEDTDLVPETRSGACNTSGAVRRAEKAILRWRDPDEGYTHGIDIVLASIQVLNCQLAEDVSAAERRDALPAQQPYVAAGRTLAGQTSWRRWPDEEVPLGVATTVPTTSAGFRTSPRYQAHVVGQRTFTQDSGGDDVFTTAVVDGYAQIAQSSAASFELVVLMPQGTIVGGNGMLNPSEVLSEEFLGRLQDELGWHVVWMGIEG